MHFSVILSDAMQDQKSSMTENIATLRAGPKITFRALNNFSVILSDAMQDQKLSMTENIAML